MSMGGGGNHTYPHCNRPCLERTRHQDNSWLESAGHVALRPSPLPSVCPPPPHGQNARRSRIRSSGDTQIPRQQQADISRSHHERASPLTCKASRGLWYRGHRLVGAPLGHPRRERHAPPATRHNCERADLAPGSRLSQEKSHRSAPPSAPCHHPTRCRDLCELVGKEAPYLRVGLGFNQRATHPPASSEFGFQ